jgi:hypothetical protein
LVEKKNDATDEMQSHSAFIFYNEDLHISKTAPKGKPDSRQALHR